jgi:hypothetical protein
VDSPFWDNVSLKVDRTKMLSCETAANAIFYALSAKPQAVPMEINLQPDSRFSSYSCNVENQRLT